MEPECRIHEVTQRHFLCSVCYGNVTATYILDMNSLRIMVDFSTKWFFIGSLKSHIVTIATHTGPLVQNLRQLWKVECKEIISTQGFITHCYKQNSLNMFLILFSYPELFILILLSFYLDLQATRFYMLMITWSL